MHRNTITALRQISEYLPRETFSNLIDQLDGSTESALAAAQQELLQVLFTHQLSADLQCTIMDAFRESCPSFNAVRRATGHTQAAIANMFTIPKRSVENWDEGSRTPPAYVILMLIEIFAARSASSEAAGNEN